MRVDLTREFSSGGRTLPVLDRDQAIITAEELLKAVESKDVSLIRAFATDLLAYAGMPLGTKKITIS